MTVRNVGVSISAVGAVIAVWLTAALNPVAALAATGAVTVLVMGGSGHPLSTPPDSISYVRGYLQSAIDDYVSPAAAAPGTGIPVAQYNRVAVVTPEEFAPDQGALTFDQSVAAGQRNLDNCIKAAGCVYNRDVGSVPPSSADTFVVYGFSQSATVATAEKRSLAKQYASGQGPDVSLVLTANGNRPNGGLLARGPRGVTIPIGLPFGGATFSGPTPTGTQYRTVDVARQYDGWSDFPVNPLNLPADLNALMGIGYLHLNSPGYQGVSLDDPGVVNQGTYGDTTYYLVPTRVLPLVTPLAQVPVIGHALADTLDPPLRVIVEAGYNRAVSPGQPTSWNPFHVPNPVKTAVDFARAIPAGLDNGIEDVTRARPFGTQRPGPFGVGGPSVDYVNPPATTAARATPAAATLRAKAAKAKKRGGAHRRVGSSRNAG